MNEEKIKFYHYWDWKTIGISGSILFGVIVFMMILFFHDAMIRSYKLSQLDEETIGEVIRIKAQESMRQTKYGNIGVIDHYTIWYNYNVNGAFYTEKNWISGNKKNGRLINKIKEDSDRVIRVKYDSSRPRKSMVILE